MNYGGPLDKASQIYHSSAPKLARYDAVCDPFVVPVSELPKLARDSSLGKQSGKAIWEHHIEY